MRKLGWIKLSEHDQELDKNKQIFFGTLNYFIHTFIFLDSIIKKNPLSNN